MNHRTRLAAVLLAATAASATAAATMGVAAAQEDTSVTIVLNEEVDLVEPCMATRSNIGRIIMQNVVETLTELDVRGDRGLMPRLATGWEDMGNGTWRFHLREGVTFSDGSAFDAEDVKHSFDRAMSDQISCEVARYFGGMKVDAKVVDPRTIDFTANPAQPIFPLLMTLVTIVPAETPIEFTRDPIGTGPYTISEWNVGQNLTVARRDNYWGELPKVTKATYVVRSDPSVRAAMVQTGEADIAPSISDLDATNKATDFPYPNAETVYIRLDHTIPPLNDQRVREALNVAIDREAFIGTLVPESAILATAIVPPTTLGHNKNVQVHPFDPERAQALLEEAAADGVPVETELELIGRTNNFPNVTEVLEALQQMFTDVGFKVDLQLYEVGEFENLYSKPYPENRGPQMVLAMHDNATGDPVFSMYFKYHSEGRQSGMSDPKVDRLITEATAATGKEREALWSELLAYLHDEVVADIPLFHMVGFARVAERLDFTPTIATNSQLQLAHIGFK
jgi:peptide/nickel transport system substrate-binding protein